MGYYGKLKEKQIAQKLRKKGLSYRDIQKITGLSKSTISKCCKSILLSESQLKSLANNRNLGQLKASRIGAESNKNKRIQSEKYFLEKGISQIGGLSKRDRFIFGIALYQGEGSKTNNALEFTNSDPFTVKFMVNWLQDFFNISPLSLKLNLWLHNNLSETDAINYWSNLLNIKSSQFGKTYFATNKVNSKKIRKQLHQFGIIKIRYYNASKLRLLLGWIKGVLSQ